MTIPRIEKRLELYAKADCDELYLYGSIGKYGDINAKEVIDALEKSKSGELMVHINSGGGEVFESVAICNLLKSCGKRISVCVDGLAASGASVIAAAGERVVMHDNAMMMLHNSWTLAAGSARELRKVAEDMDKIDSALNKTYMTRFKGTQEELKALLDDETWLTAAECEALGFCDEVLDGGADEENPTSNSAKADILAKYAHSQEKPKEPETAEISEQEKQNHRAGIMGSFLTALAKQVYSE